MRLLLLFVALALLTPPPAHAVKLRFAVKPGDAWTINGNMKASGRYEIGGMNLDFAMEAKSSTIHTISEVKPDGSLVSSLNHRTELMKVMVGGMEIPTPAETATNPYTVTYSPLGKVLKIEGFVRQSNPMASPDFGRAISAVLTPLPGREVNVGDEWGMPADGAIPTSVRCKLVSVKKEGGREVARLEATLTTTGEGLQKIAKELLGADAFEFSGPGFTVVSTIDLDLASGVMLRSKGTLEGDITVRIMGMEIRQVIRGEQEETVKR